MGEKRQPSPELMRLAMLGPARSRNESDRFHHVRRIGRGPLGVVYEAQETATGRMVAVKQWQADGEEDPHHAPNHPGLVPLIERGRSGDTSFLVMEMMPEGSLRSSIDRIRNQRRDGIPPGFISYAAGALAQVAETLHAIHEEGQIHRGIKPQNLLFTDSGRRLLVSDLHPVNGTDVLRVSCVKEESSTLRYVAPELRDATQTTVDRRVDIYSLGICLYEMLLLQPPPAHDAGLDSALPGELADVVLRCIRADPDRRYSTAREVQQDLLTLL